MYFYYFGLQFVRVEHKTPPKKLLHLIQKQWNLGQPKLLISVTGGALDFPLNSRLKDVFRKGLIKAALSTGDDDQKELNHEMSNETHLSCHTALCRTEDNCLVKCVVSFLAGGPPQLCLS